ncbi:hypothetical protein SDC9_31621 [bioreactor metagenome]|uniref:Uncharacterized protein n=1 Tax=bioreactor metagenome TaxID=1076179 RepID=A0A644V2U2_9ZZZZ
MRLKTQEIGGLLLELFPEIQAAFIQPPAYGEIAFNVTFHSDRPTRIATSRTEHKLISAPSTREDRMLSPDSPFNKSLECLNKEVKHV